MQKNFSSVLSRCSTANTQSLFNIKILKENKRQQKSMRLIKYYCTEYSAKQDKFVQNFIKTKQGKKLSLDFIDFCVPQNVKIVNPQKLMKRVYEGQTNLKQSHIEKPINLKLRINSKQIRPTIKLQKSLSQNSRTQAIDQQKLTEYMNQGQISFKNSQKLMRKSTKSAINIYKARSQIKKIEQQEHEEAINKKIKDAIKQFYKNVEIFKKILCDVKRKKQIIEKIYGWNKNFNQILFVSTSMNAYNDMNLSKKTNNQRLVMNTLSSSSQDLIMFFDLQDVIQNLNLNKERLNIDKKYFCQKLKLFNTQLVQFNEKQHNLKTQSQKNRMKERLLKINSKLQNFKNSPLKEKKQYYLSIKDSHKHLGEIKQKIQNKKENIKKIQQETGKLKINEFEIQVESKITQIQKVILNIQNENDSKLNENELK